VAFATSSDRDILTELDDRPGAEMTARLLLALTALYIQRPTHTGKNSSNTLSLRCASSTRSRRRRETAVARILQRHPNAPAEVVERLGGRQCSRDGGPEGELTRINTLQAINPLKAICTWPIGNGMRRPRRGTLLRGGNWP